MQKVPVIAAYNSVQGADIRWKKVNGASGYVVYRQRSSEGTRKVATIGNVNTVQCYDSSIQYNCWGRVYHYYVYALYGNKEGPKSDPLILQRLAPMKITSCTSPSVGNALLKWACSVNDNKALGYEIQYATSKADLQGQKGFFRTIAINGRNSLSGTITGLSKGTTYYFRIRCYVNYTNSKTGKITKTWSQYSNVANVKIMSVKPQIRITTSSGESGSVNINAGKTIQLRATVTGTSGTLIWKSNNTSVATVSSSGLVTARRVGTVTITATCGSISNTFTIIVKNTARSRDISDYLHLNIHQAAAAIGWKRITNYGGNALILYNQDGVYRTDPSYISTESYNQYSSGKWNAVIHFKSLTVFGVDIGMSYTEAQRILSSTGKWKHTFTNQFGIVYSNTQNSSGILISFGYENKVSQIQYLWNMD